MNIIRTIILQELRANLKRRSYLLMALGVPLLALAVVIGMTIFKGDNADEPDDPLADLPEDPIGYVDHSGLFQEPGDYWLFLTRFESEDEARRATEQGDLSGYYVIAADYLASGQVTRYAPELNLAGSDIGLIQSFLVSTMLKDDSSLLFARLQSPAYVIEHQLDRSGAQIAEIEGSSFDNFGIVYAFAMLMLLSTFLSAGQLMQSVIKEKENRMIEIVLSSLRPVQLMAGKVLGQGLAGLIQVALWLGTILLLVQITDANIPFIGQVDLPPSLYVLMVFYFLGGYLLFAAFSAGIGAISANLREGPQYAIVYTLPAVLPMMFLSNVLEAPNSPLAVGLSLFPLCAPLGMVERLVVTAVPGWQIGLSLALLFASMAGALWLSARLFRVNTLLSGQMPTRQELVKLLLHG